MLDFMTSMKVTLGNNGWVPGKAANTLAVGPGHIARENGQGRGQDRKVSTEVA